MASNYIENDVIEVLTIGESNNNDNSLKEDAVFEYDTSNSHQAILEGEENSSRVNNNAVKYDINNATTDVVVLLDISSNKDWICYVHHLRSDLDQNICISRQHFKKPDTRNISGSTAAASERTQQDQNSVYIDMPLDSVQPFKKKPFIFNEYYQEMKKHTKFLSISPDGKYIAFSYFEEPDKGANVEKGKSRCIIFKVEDNSIVYYTKLKNCNGRAVFLDRQSKKLCLAIINTETLEIYSDFSKYNKGPSHIYDLAPFGSSLQTLRESIAIQESYIKEHISWVNFSESVGNADAMKIVALSRHIRHDVLVTPFSNGGIVRLWSIKDNGVRLSSFGAPDEHIVALSKDLKYAATITEGIRTVKIYNVKNGLLVYTLQSRYEGDKDTLLEVTHARFCYESRYLALSGLQKKFTDDECIMEAVFFEVWYIEAEKSIYRKTCNVIRNGKHSNKTVKPFVYRGMTDAGKKCLKGIYTHFEYTHSRVETNEIRCIELGIDDQEEESQDKQIDVDWIKHPNIPYKVDEHEIQNSLNEHGFLKCGEFTVGSKRYFIRFGNRMIQLWILDESTDSIEEKKNHQLVYIRAYKGPSYGHAYSFRDTWEIYDFNSIKFINGPPTGRMIVNIKQSENSLTDEEKKDLEGAYHTEEIFLPIMGDHKELNKFDYHTFESACQALHYLQSCWEVKQYRTKISEYSDSQDEIEEVKFMAGLRNFGKKDRDEKKKSFYEDKKYKMNLLDLFKKTYKLIENAVPDKDDGDSNYFATMAGSRTLAMLASFAEGREIIKLLLKSNATTPISIISYSRSIRDIKSTITKVDENVNIEAQAILKRTMEKPEDFNKWNGCHDYRNSPKITESISKNLSPIAENENVLTVLITELSYNLYKLMFNRILSDSKKIGPGCLSALADALLFLQEEGNTDLLLKSSQKLSYLVIDKVTLGILNSEMGEVLKVKDLQKEYVSNIRNLECHSTMEQIEKYRVVPWNLSYHIFYKLNKYIKYKSDNRKNLRSMIKSILTKPLQLPIIKRFNMTKKDGPKNRTQICVVPLPYFNTYNILLEDRPKNKTLCEERSLLRKLNPFSRDDDKIYKTNSAFVAVASNQNSNNIFRQGDTVLEVMLQYKWKKFLRWRFVFVCLIHAAYYISYSTGVLFALEMYGFDSNDNQRSISAHGGHLASIIVMFFSGAVLLAQEINQICRSAHILDYFTSGYNWIDLLAFVLPLITFLQLILNWKNFYEISSLATLFLWLHGILRLRVISFVGIALEIIIQLSQKVWSILFIFLLVVLAFTNSFMVLLRQREDTYFQENYNGTTTLTNSSAPIDSEEQTLIGNTTLYDISSSNGFNNPYKAFYQVWLLIFGVWDPITNGEAGDDEMLFFLCMLFALITVLIFTNMVIALMSSTVDEVKNKGNKVWVSHFAAVVAEIEQLWCFPVTKRNRNNNPTYIYYIANYDAVQRQEEKLDAETKDLRMKVLGIDDEDKKPECNCSTSSIERSGTCTQK